MSLGLSVRRGLRGCAFLFGCVSLRGGGALGVRERLREVWEGWRAESDVREVEAAGGGSRKTAALPAVLTAYRPVGVANAMPKPTAANLRRFAETPLARRAINVVKDRIASMEWQVRWKRDANRGEGREDSLKEENSLAGGTKVQTGAASQQVSGKICLQRVVTISDCFVLCGAGWRCRTRVIRFAR